MNARRIRNLVVTLTLLLAGPAWGGSISGLVEDSGANPVVGATVTAYNDFSGTFLAEATTDSMGAYFMDVGSFSQQVFLIVTGSADYANTIYNGSGTDVFCGFEFSCDVAGAQASPATSFFVDAGGSATANVVVSPGRQMRVTSQDTSMGAIGNVDIRIFDASGNADQFLTPLTTDEIGEVLTPALPDGDYYVLGLPPEGTPYQTGFGLNVPCLGMTDCSDPIGAGADAVTMTASLGQPAIPGRVQLSDGGRVTGRITDSGGLGLFGAQACIVLSTGEATGICAFSDENGDFVTAGLPDRFDYTLLATADGFIAEHYNDVPALPRDFGSATTFGVTGGSDTNLPASIALDNGASISGTVTPDFPAKGSFSGLADVIVEVFALDGETVLTRSITDTMGDYTTEALPDGEYYVLFTGAGSSEDFLPELHDNILCVNGQCDITSGTPVAIAGSDVFVNATLFQGSQLFGAIAQSNETPMPDVEVRIHGADGAVLYTTATDSQGEWSMTVTPASTVANGGTGGYFASYVAAEQGFLSGVVSGSFSITYCPEPDLLCDQPATIVDNGQEFEAFQGEGASISLDAFLDPGFFFGGIVHETDGTTPIAGAVVCAYRPDTGEPTGACGTTDGNGDYSTFPPMAEEVQQFTEASKGIFRGFVLEARAGAEFSVEMFQEQPCPGGTCDYSQGDTIGLNAFSASGVDFTLDPVLYTIGGTVSDAETASLIAGATVCIEASGGGTPDCSATTDANGLYTSPAVRAGDYDLTGQKAGYADATISVTVNNEIGSLTNQGIALLREKGAISGTVVLMDDGSAISNLRIALFDSLGDPAGETLTAVDGSYTLSAIPTGNYFVVADGSERGFISEIFASRDGMGDLIEITCDDDNDCSTRLLDGQSEPTPAVLSVTNDTTLMDTDFELQAGDVLSPENLEEFDQMGAAVALCGSRAAIGIPGHDDDVLGVDVGKVSIYVREGTGYQFSQDLLPDTSDGQVVAGGRFGASLSCDGDLIVVGAPGDGVVAKSLGAKGGGPAKAAYVMQMTGNSADSLGTLIASNLGMADDSGWGQSVSIQGGALAVGAPNAMGASNTNSGAVAMFDIDPQSAVLSTDPSAIISDPSGGEGDSFGTSISVNQGQIAVGSPKQTPSGLGANPSGMAHIFQNLAGSGWGSSPAASIAPPSGQSGDDFGTSVSLQGGMMAAGAPGDDTAGENAGAAHVFQFNEGGNLTAVGGPITPTASDPGAGFGSSVSLSGTSLAIGAPSASVPGKPTKTGAAYLFGFGSLQPGIWNQVAQALSNAGQQGDLFGASVAYDGSGFVVGAPNGVRLGTQSGFVQVAVQNDTLFKGSFE